MNQNPPSRSFYLPGLLGLRFLAAFSVFFGHLEQAKSWVAWEPFPIPLSSYVTGDGVTLFFTLSGFLITLILLREKLQSGTLSIRKFYTRRVLRIWPLYYLFALMVFLVIPHIPFLHFPIIKMPPGYPFFEMPSGTSFWASFGLYLMLSPHVATTLFTSPGVGGPLWSVGVEEYFYLFWPHLIKQSKQIWHLGFWLVLATPLVMRAMGSPRWSLFFELFRIDCMAIGGLGAWIYLHHKKVLDVIFMWQVQVVAYGMAIYHLTANSSYAPWRADTFSLVFIVIIMNVALNPKTLLKLENRFFRFMGEISYGFYVFQWLANVICINALILLGGIAHPLLRSSVLLVADFALTTMLASISYYGWEKKFLRLKSS